MGVAVSHASLLAQCQALTQACGYSEGEGGAALRPGTRHLDAVPRSVCCLIQVVRLACSGPLLSWTGGVWTLALQSVKPTHYPLVCAQWAGSSCAVAEGQRILRFLIGTHFFLLFSVAGFGLSCHALGCTSGIFVVRACLLAIYRQLPPLL